MQVASVWSIELAELDSLTRATADRVKAFVSRATDRFRPPYGSRVIEQPRQSVFAGSVNHSAYLRDETGARRFWPVACMAIDLDALGRDRDQIWAETRQRYLSGEPWWLDTPELHAQAAEAQSQRYTGDPWQQAIEDYIAGKASVSVSEILTNVLAIRSEVGPRYMRIAWRGACGPWDGFGARDVLACHRPAIASGAISRRYSGDSGDILGLFGLHHRLRCPRLGPIPGLSGDSGFGLRRRRLELRQDRLQQIEPRRELITLIIEFLAQISGEHGGLIVCQIESHPRQCGRLN
jgi:hypothetical protein